ncbi:lysophospholipase [Plasmodium brasilianum]|uniref:Lysophospholipase n=1 Tax=Plasmodium brasilianum TaxID=5824 RepID=A0ACB9YED2_PLABR|nr:lysophospholipase [Plasmodium brasilianum]
MTECELLDNEKTYTKLDGKPRIDSFFNKDGLLLRTYGWLVKNAIGIIVLIHGIQSHTRITFLRHNIEIGNNDKVIIKDADDFYVYKDSWIEHFNKNGYSVFGLDLQGHGLSDGWKNLYLHINNFDDFAYDVIQYINKIHETSITDSENCITSYDDNEKKKKKNNNNSNIKKLPIYLIGFSMGGNIVLRTLELLGKVNNNSNSNLNIKGCISLSGMVSLQQLPPPKTSAFKNIMLLSKCVARCFPTFRLFYKCPHNMHPVIKVLLTSDKIRSKKSITCIFGSELLRAMYNLENDMKHIPKDIPILFVHSKQDSICYYGGVSSFYNRLDVENKELHTIDKMDHIIVWEPGNEKILEKIIEWLRDLQEK